ncbi:MAG: N-acyl homoserine lactonase family protein [Roseivirga sp.]|nr:N-acyl homoserine lactonase family protein [Roseivirga sp.]
MNRKFSWTVALLIMLLGSGCTGKKSDKSKEQDIASLEMYVFDVGKIQVNDISQLNGGEEVKAPVYFTNTAFLIRHPKGDLIWDTGFADSVVNHPMGEVTSPYYSTMEKTLSSQLDEIGVGPDNVKYLAVSHKHPDHSGNMSLFSESTIILQEAEYQALFESETPGIVLEGLDDNEFIKLDGELDVFCDGTVVVIPTPGHTEGHQVLFVNLPETGPIILSGDLWLFNTGVRSQAVPLFNENVAETSASWEKVQALLREKKATLWVQHDSEQMLAIPHSPKALH